MMKMSKPPFVMSKYLSKEDLYKDKADYYQERCKNAEIVLEKLLDLGLDEILEQLLGDRNE